MTRSNKGHIRLLIALPPFTEYHAGVMGWWLDDSRNRKKFMEYGNI